MKILCLNSNYVPIRLTSKFNAITKMFTGMAEAIYVKDGETRCIPWNKWLEMSTNSHYWPSDQQYIQSVTQPIALPAIIKFTEYSKIPKVTLRLTRKALYERDGYRCYLCGKEFNERKLSIDHIKPLSKGGGNSWENCITCCRICNFNKGDKTLAEFGIKPKFAAYRPNLSNIAKLKASISVMRPEWEMYLS